MITIDNIAAVVRSMLRVAPQQLVAPRVLAHALELQLVAESGCRARLDGWCIIYDDTASQREQEYQIARFACTHVLRALKFIRSDLTAHDLAFVLCGIGSAPPVVQARALRARR